MTPYSIDYAIVGVIKNHFSKLLMKIKHTLSLRGILPLIMSLGWVELWVRSWESVANTGEIQTSLGGVFAFSFHGLYAG